MEARSVYAPTAGKAVEWLLGGPEGLANVLVDGYRSEMSDRGLPVTTINRRPAALRSLVKLANTFGLVTWTLRVKNMPVQPYRDTCGPGRDGSRAMLDAAGAQPGPKGLRDVALLRLLHDLGLRRSEAVRLDIEDVDLPGKRISLLSRGRSWKEPVALPEPDPGCPCRLARGARLRTRSAVCQFRSGRQGPSSDRHRGLPHRRPARRQGRPLGPTAGAAPSRDHHGTRAD